MTSLSVRAYAKINLSLDVFDKRADGFHSLASVMQTISLHDTIVLTPNTGPDITITCDGDHAEGVPTDSTNLVVRAARALLDAAHHDGGLVIRLNKRVPSQAGLGGGSSDAAATLLGTASVLGIDVGPKLLHSLAASLGSDVPFFLTGGTAVVRGRGENIKPIVDCPPLWLTIVKPPLSVSTAWAFAALDATFERRSNRGTVTLEAAIKESDARKVVACQSNDFEVPVFHAHPGLSWLRDELRMAGALASHLCGSGSAVYGVARDEAHAIKMTSLVKSSYPYTYLAKTVSSIEANPLRESET